MRSLPIAVLIAVAALLVSPAGAFEAGALEIQVQPDGDAVASLSYGLNWFERAGVYLGIASPSAELGAVLSGVVGREVRVTGVDMHRAVIVIPDFATVSSTDERTVYRTSGFDFTRFSSVLAGYWFAPLVSPDFSPSSITLVFPDGFTEHLPGGTRIPAVMHTA
jgi:hypothetical protein